MFILGWKTAMLITHPHVYTVSSPGYSCYLDPTGINLTVVDNCFDPLTLFPCPDVKDISTKDAGSHPFQPHYSPGVDSASNRNEY
jgi:hypothetical protein